MSALRDFRYGAHTDHDLIDLRRRRFGFVFQQPYLLVWQTAHGKRAHGRARPGQCRPRQSRRLLSTSLGIADLADKLPSQLVRRRKAARLCRPRHDERPRVIFADEPTASLDHANGHLVIDLLSAYRERGTVVVVTHDPEMLQGADQILLMRDGQEQGWVAPATCPDRPQQDSRRVAALPYQRCLHVPTALSARTNGGPIWSAVGMP